MKADRCRKSGRIALGRTRTPSAYRIVAVWLRTARHRKTIELIHRKPRFVNLSKNSVRHTAIFQSMVIVTSPTKPAHHSTQNQNSTNT